MHCILTREAITVITLHLLANAKYYVQNVNTFMYDVINCITLQQTCRR